MCDAQRVLASLLATGVILLVMCQRRPGAGSARVQPERSPQTKITDVDQSALQQKDFGTLAEVSMLPPKGFVGSYWLTHVHAEGAWVMDEGPLAWPVNAGIVTCYRERRECIDTTAFVFAGMLNSDTNIREVEHWDEHEILTKPTDSACVRSTLRISREQQAVTEVQTTLRTDGPCAGLKLGDQHLRLLDGHQVAIDLRTKHGQESKTTK